MFGVWANPVGGVGGTYERGPIFSPIFGPVGISRAGPETVWSLPRIADLAGIATCSEAMRRGSTGTATNGVTEDSEAIGEALVTEGGTAKRCELTVGVTSTTPQLEPIIALQNANLLDNVLRCSGLFFFEFKFGKFEALFDVGIFETFCCVLGTAVVFCCSKHIWSQRKTFDKKASE
jgi:hypothetical protein